MAGRGVDILLGGNPDGLASRQARAEGLEPGTPEYDERYAELVAKFEPECAAEGDVVRSLGGLYVLGTERHESRRIDNQLRGRSGRQGDPGESRFYLSLEDELMRLFATGAMNWVMGRALPEEEAIEAKMVTKAIERAQNTVEQRNGEVRKNVLKYDEVMNEQRKVIYARRDQILEGDSLRDEVLEYLAGAVDDMVGTFCDTEDPAEWDLAGLVAEAGSYWPTSTTEGDLGVCTASDEVYELLMAEALAHYETREAEVGAEAMRQIERQVMLRIIDQRWREHLAEMDYLREGIHLRAMGQKDPLTEWQRDGFEMFGTMMESAGRDFVKYVMHANITMAQQPGAEPEATNVQYSAPLDPSEEGPSLAALAGADAPTPQAATTSGEPATKAPVVKSEWDRTPRNAECPCGSGKKFKFCHGAR
jgi:preprotein translocase subunit SecA